MKAISLKKIISFLKLNCMKYVTKPRQLVLIALISGIIIIVLNYKLSEEEEEEEYFHPRWNAFNDSILPPGDKTQKYVVDMPNCKIPEMHPFDLSIRPYRLTDDRGVKDCRSANRGWFILNGTELKLNESALFESGYSNESINCCYRVIERVEQPRYDYNMDADNGFRYSDKCQPIRNGSATVNAAFIRVHCMSNSTTFLWEVVYRDYFAVASPDVDRHVQSKITNAKIKWGGKSNHSNSTSNSTFSPPPNVIIVGLDTVSRMNSLRHLPKTLELLKNLGAVELKGYNTIGQSTWANARAFMSGYYYSRLSYVCYPSDNIRQDDCPYIWKPYDASGYLTVHAEDSPQLSIFNYKKAGFARQQVDFYLRPLMLARKAHTARILKLPYEDVRAGGTERDYMYTGCIGPRMPYEFIHDYILDIVQMGQLHSIPTFALTWITNLSHQNYNNLQFGDDDLVNVIQRLIQISQDNTIIFFMSDHGLRYGGLRETVQGWYEVKLPMNWIYLPHKIRHKYPSWLEGLKYNSDKVTSPFDTYKTFVHILQTFNGNDSTFNSHFFKEINLQAGQSLFTPVPLNRTCIDAGIDIEYCPCFSPKPLDASSEVLKTAAQAAVNHLAKKIPLSVCEEPSLLKVVSGGYLDNPQRPGYLVTMYTSPGDFLFEVIVEKNMTTRALVVNADFFRLNAITRWTKCVNTSTLETLCYCKNIE